MARPKLGTLYKVKGTDNWFFQKKGYAGRIDTGTSDRFRAEQFLRSATAKVGDPNPSPEEQQIADGLQTLAASLDPRFKPEHQKSPEVKDESLPSDDADFGERVKPVAPTFSNKPLPLPSQTAQGQKTATESKAGIILDNFKSRFTPQKRERLFGALGSGVARVNALAYELGLGVGNMRLKDAYVFSPEDLEILKTAYEMGLDELFEATDPRWYHLALVGNVSMIVGSLPYIEKKPPKIAKGATPEEPNNGN